MENAKWAMENKYIKNKLFSLFLFHLIFLLLLITNFPFGKYFLGWDSITPEFNLELNFLRSFSGFWQEYYGLGVVGGHGFSATLPHTIIIAILSLFFPEEALRPVFTFLCLYLGGLGMYILTYKQLNNATMKQSNNNLEYISLFVSLFYMLNIATIQIFSVQLEAFIAHFAALPFLVWSIILVLNSPSRKNLLLFFFIQFFGTIQGFIPSLFVSYGMIAAFFLIGFLIKEHFSPFAFKRTSLIVILLLVINLYWLSPVLYFQFTQGDVFLNSYNNMLSTPHFISLTQKYGDFSHVARLQGPFLEAFELGDFVLKPWITHHNHFFISVISYLLFFTAVLGSITVFLKFNSWTAKIISLLFLLFFGLLAIDVLPFSFFTNLLQEFNPTYKQAFRSAFTKYSISLSFSMSLCVGFGIMYITHVLRDSSSQNGNATVILEGGDSRPIGSLDSIASLQNDKYVTEIINNSRFPTYFLVFVFFLLLFYTYPAFSGNLLYKNLVITFPNVYQEVITYLKQQENGRIADFPQDCQEGWYSYNWGYFGSGFYWYGVKQPFLARPFDVWSSYNENYYWEITQALRSQQYNQVDAIMAKYNVQWILYDPNMLFCRNQKNFFIHEAFKKHLDSSSSYQLQKTFTDNNLLPIYLYQYTKQTTTSFISLTNNLPTIGKYTWTDTDLAFYENGDYETNDINPSVMYPFLGLFTKRGQPTKDIKQEKEWIILKTSIAETNVPYQLVLNSYIKHEQIMPIKFTINQTAPESYTLEATLLLPTFFIDNKPLLPSTPSILLGTFFASDLKNITVSLNDMPLTKGTDNTFNALLPLTSEINVEVLDNTTNTTLFTGGNQIKWEEIINQMPTIISLPTTKKSTFSVAIPAIPIQKLPGTPKPQSIKTYLPFSCNGQKSNDNLYYEAATTYFRLTSKASDQCLTLPLVATPTDWAYLVTVQARNKTGLPLKMAILNKNRILYNQTYLTPSTKDFENYYALIPPTLPYELGYDILFENTSENNIESSNDISAINTYPFPFTYLRSIKLYNPQAINEYTQSSTNKNIKVSHPLSFIYTITIPSNNLGTKANLVLSQQFNKGWKAYQIESGKLKIEKENQFSTFSTFNFQLSTLFPFFLGKELSEHVLINNWANGWRLETTGYNLPRTYIVIFLPQYIQFIAYGLLFFALLGVLLKRQRS